MILGAIEGDREVEIDKLSGFVMKVGIIFVMIFIITKGSMAEETRLIVRGDDLGMTQGSLVAFEQAYRGGILTCASVLVCAPWFEGAIVLLKSNPRLCAGVHLSVCVLGFTSR